MTNHRAEGPLLHDISNEAPPQTDKACTEEQARGCVREELRSRETGGIGTIAPGMMTGKRSDGR